jgi:ubiquinone/menaquinone biosynthesis C-methylase UbiE
MNKNESLTEQEARDKNIEEYNQTADAYDTWSQENILM